MDKNIVLTAVVLLVCCSLFAQNKAKRLIDNESYKSWDKINMRDYDISHDGKFVYYFLEDGTLTIVSTDKKIKKTISGTSGSCFFTSDGKSVGYKTGAGHFVIENFITNQTDTIPFVDRAEKVNHFGKDYLLYSSKGKLCLRDLKTKHSHEIAEGVDQYWINTQKNAIVYTSVAGLFWWDFKSRIVKRMLEESQIRNATFDKSGGRFLFLYPSGKENSEYIVGYYSVFSKKTEIIDSQSEGLDTSLYITNGPLKFNSDGTHVAFTLAKREILDKSSGRFKDRMTIWNYDDHERYLEQQDKIPLVSYAIKNIATEKSKVILLDMGHDRLIGSLGRNLLLVERHFISTAEEFQGIGRKSEFRIISLADGSCKSVVPKTAQSPANIRLSPDEKYVYWYNLIDDNIYTYELNSNKLRNVTQDIRIAKDMKLQSGGSLAYRFVNRGLISDNEWLLNDHAFLIRDQFDIWQVDPSSRVGAINLTGGYGRKNNTTLDFLPETGKFKNSQKIPLRAFDFNSGSNGFATIRLGSENSLIMGKLGPHLYSWALTPSAPPVKKAVNTSAWLMMRQSANESPNLVLTYDFNHYLDISNVHPEKEYNWLNAEFIKYPMNNNKEGKGILYKPENFDPNKKYPVIFHYYQKKSDGLHVFLSPELSSGTINIPWYVSNGYIVAVPDIINDQPGKIAETVLASVNSLADYLVSFPWINSTKMGLQGHSFGGYETNLLIAGSDRFAAAQSSAGISDAFKGATELTFGLPGFFIYEYGQHNFNCTIWDCVDVYIKNSPIFRADKVTTPLLLMHNRKDYVVPFTQSEGLFYALRRLRKPAWLVQYEDGGHGLDNPDDRLDFAIRQEQFFDHYLKGRPKPKWMTIPSLSMQVDSVESISNK